MKLGAIAEKVDAAVRGNSEVEIVRVSAFINAGPDALVFIERAGSLAAAEASGAGAIVAPEGTAPIGTAHGGTPLLISKYPRLAFARAAQSLRPPAVPARIHPTASIGTASIGEGTSIGAGCSIADGVMLGRDCVLYSNVTVYAGAIIGDRVIVHAGAVLGADGFGYVRDPATGAYVQFPQQGTLVIEDDVEIGANTTIDRGALEETRIGRGTKVDNLVHIGHNCRIGKNVVIASQTGISGSCTIGDGAVLGGQVGMGDHVTIGDGVILGGGAGILPHKKVKGAGQVFWGTPAKPLKRYLKELATLSRLTHGPGEDE